MALRKIVLGGAAVATLALFSVSMPTAVPSLVTPAQAAVDVSISIGAFYDDLAPYGDWVTYNNNYVFVPGGADPRWRPYTRGRWENTNRYGWVWVSGDPHGWATHHYGRWGFGPGIGWYWVPDTVWGPAWVDWRRDDDYVAWAPLAPAADGVTIVIDAAPAPVPDFYWAAVATPNFLSVNLSLNIIDDDRAYGIVRRARPIGYVRPRGNVIVNNFIEVNYIERRTRKKVVVRDVRDTRDRREAGRRKGNELAIYNPRVERKPDARPRKAENVEQVARKKRAENPEFAAKVEERQKRQALKRDTTEETEQTTRKDKREKAQEAKQQPAEATTKKQEDRAAARQKQREENAAKKQREQNDAKKQQRDESAGKKQQQDNAAKKQQRQDARKAREQQEEAAQPVRKQQDRKKQQQQQSLTPTQPANAKQEQRTQKQQDRQAKQADRQQAKQQGDNRKKKKQQEEATQ